MFSFPFSDIFCFGQQFLCIKMKFLYRSKTRHDRVILVFFSDSFSKNTLKKHQHCIYKITFAQNFFSIFYRNPKIRTFDRAKSRHDGAQRMSDSTAKKT